MRITSGWRSRHGQLYDEATTGHPYIASIRNGSVDFGGYKRWLGQDYIFVKAFVRFIASVILKIPKGTNDKTFMTLLAGAAALHDELQWFQGQASAWKIDLQNLPPERAAQEYCRFLEQMSEPEVDYAVAVATLWAIELVYCESFTSCLTPDAKTPPELQEACNRWGSPEFKSYCDSLQAIAESCMQNVPEGVRQGAEHAFTRVLQLEVDFWNMTRNDSSGKEVEEAVQSRQSIGQVERKEGPDEG